MAESEFELLRRFTAFGDAEAFTEIVKQHASLVYGVCLRILGNKDTASDAVQDTFLQLVRDAAKITGSLPNWLHRTATNRAIDIIRKDSQRKKREFNYAAGSESINVEDEKAAWREISVCIDEELDNLDDQTKEVLILRFFEGLTTNDIAEKCNITQLTVYRWMESGIELLRLKLKSRGVIVPAAILTALLTENIVKAAPASIMKELGKIALAGSRVTIGAKIASTVSAGIAVKTKIMAGILIVLFGAGLTVVFSFIANGEDKPASPWELVRDSLREEASSDPNTNQAVPSDINQILDKFAKLRENINSFIAESRQECKYKWELETEKYSGTMYSQDFIAYDGKRRKKTSSSWGNLNPIQTNVSESNPDFSASLWDGEIDYSYTRSESGSSSGYVIITNPGDDEKDTIIQPDYKRHVTGYANFEEERFDELLKENLSQVTLREKTENIHGFDCYVIDADIYDRGEYHIWIDPEHDYHIVKMQVNRSENDLSHGNKIEKGCFTKETYEVFSFEQYGDAWFPKECKETSEKTTYDHPRSEVRTTTFTRVVFNPDFEALGTFKPDFIKNGAKADIIDAIQTREGKTFSVDGEFIWKDGKIVDSYGYEFNLSILKQTSFMNKTLPSIAEFGVDLNPDVFKNKKLLICFFDYSQRPSRNCVLTLNEKTQSLLDKDIFLIFIQAASINEQTLNNWLRQNEIVPSVGMSKINLHELDLRWGVKALPWLIMTDERHIVTAEGFSIAELDEKIKAMGER